MSAGLVPVGASDFTVRSYEADAWGELRLPALCDLFQEAADQHARTFGAALDQVAETWGEAWVLYRLAVRVARPARWREALRVETWPCGQERLYSVREFRAVSSGGELLAEGASAWLAMDLSTRRLSRSPRTPLDWRSERGRAWPEAFVGRVAPVSARAPAVELPVRRGDIDRNGHVNHVHYVAWALEAAPEALWQTQRPAAVTVEYVAEARAGDAVRVRAEADGDATRCEMLRGDEVLARAAVRWAPRG